MTVTLNTFKNGLGTFVEVWISVCVILKNNMGFAAIKWDGKANSMKRKIIRTLEEYKAEQTIEHKI